MQISELQEKFLSGGSKIDIYHSELNVLCRVTVRVHCFFSQIHFITLCARPGKFIKKRIGLNLITLVPEAFYYKRVLFDKRGICLSAFTIPSSFANIEISVSVGNILNKLSTLLCWKQ